MAIDLQTTLLRVVALQKEALLALTTPVVADAFPYFLHTQATFPYFINRIGEWTSEGDSEDFDQDTYTVIMRLVIAHATSGYQGDNDNNLYTYIPQIKTYFNERQLLQSAAYPTRPDDLTWARCGEGTGLLLFKHTGVNGEVTQVGTEWTLTCNYSELIEQQYL